MQTRRSTDHEQVEIEALIAEENDPKIRLQLMVMNRINLSLIAHSQTINEIAEKLDAHLAHYSAHIEQNSAATNQKRGMKRVGIALFGIAQGTLLWLATSATNTVSELYHMQTENLVQHAGFDSRITVLEKQKENQ